ncbi:MAG: helix-turn-helix transcriptional regulator [Planctomycetota bacterium]
MDRPRLLRGEHIGRVGGRVETERFAIVEVVNNTELDVPLHEHGPPHFCFVVSGDYFVRSGSDVTGYPAATLVYYPTATVHRDRLGSAGSRFLGVSVRPEQVEELDEVVGFANASSSLQDPRLAPLCYRLYRAFARDHDQDTVLMEALALELVAMAGRRPLPPLRRRPTWLELALEAMRSGNHHALRIGDVAREIGIHPVHMVRVFRQFLGCTPADYLRACRVDSAIREIIADDSPLSQVALDCGFHDQSHLTRVFKRQTGTTPAAFRRLVRLPSTAR